MASVVLRRSRSIVAALVQFAAPKHAAKSLSNMESTAVLVLVAEYRRVGRSRRTMAGLDSHPVVAGRRLTRGIS